MKRINVKKFLFLFLFLVLSGCVFCGPLSAQEHTTWEDFKTTLGYMGKGSYLQFTSTPTQVALLMGGASMYYLLRHNDFHDKRMSNSISNKSMPKYIETISDYSPIFNSPLFPAIFYAVARNNQDEKMIRFAQEYLATLGLTQIEANLLSAIPIHERPNTDDLNMWETRFRFGSSFPSGHTLGYLTLGLKAIQFYGPLYGVLPIAMGVATAYERVQSEKHYLSDVVMSFFFAFMGSEGVRMASSFKDNHPTYKWLFENNLNISYMRYLDAPGLRVSFHY